MLRDYQQRAFNSIKNYCLYNKGNPLATVATGGGKSHIIAEVAKWVTSYPDKKVLILAHRKELIEQNAKKIDLPVSIYSAGLNKKEHTENIIVAGIQSVFPNIQEFPKIDCIIIDECHTLSFDKDSMYRRVIDFFGCRYIGFTATPYRLAGGMLCPKIFDQEVCNVTITELTPKYLSPLISRVSKIQPKLDNVKVVAGDYVINQLEDAMVEPSMAIEATEQILKYGADRKKWILFCVSIKHAEAMKDLLQDNFIDCEVVSSKTHKDERKKILDNYINGGLRCIINVDVLTTGFDAPNIDMLVMLRPTKSTSLYVQCIGRATRKHPDKENALILDFAGNIAEHGSVEKVKLTYNPITEKTEKAEYTDKVCPVCEAVNDIKNTQCFDCGEEFIIVREVHHATEPSDIDVNLEPPQWKPVTGISYSRHQGKNGKKDTLKITYLSNFQSYNEWIGIEHDNKFYKNKCFEKLNIKDSLLEQALRNNNIPTGDDVCKSAIDYIVDNQNIIIPPTRILVDLNDKFPQVKGYDYKAIERSGHTEVIDKMDKEIAELVEAGLF